jgi:long-chain acyl-CoA synthetase
MDIKKITLFGRKDVKVYSDRPKNIQSILSNHLENLKDKEAIVTEEKTLTYLELDYYSSSIAAYLQKKCDVKKGDRIATIIGNRYHFPLLVFACAKLGAIMFMFAIEKGYDKPKWGKNIFN